MTQNISLTRKNKGYSKKEVAAQVKPKQSSTKHMLKNPHDFAPYFPNQQNKNKQSNKKEKKRLPLDVSRFILQRSVWLTRNMNFIFKHIQERNQNTNAINIHIMNLFRDRGGKKE